MIKYVADVRVRKIDKNGNTYHDVGLYNLDKELLREVKHIYGYGVQYKTTVASILLDLGVITPEQWVEQSSIVNDLVLFVVNNY